MKFLHTADWHLGNSMFEIDRTAEFENFLCWLKEKIISEKIDVLIIAGDIFDTINPPVISRKQYNSFLASLLQTECRNVIIIGGNHDSGILLDSQKDILEALNIHVVGTVSNLKPEEMVFELFGRNGEVIGLCAAVPFARENELRNYIEEKDDVRKSSEVYQQEFEFEAPPNFSDEAYGALYKKVFEKAEEIRNGRNIPIIATGHLFAADLEGRFANAETEVKCDDGRRNLDVVGNLGSVHAGIFPKGFDYVALGHIHYCTCVGKQPRIRYSGSPFVLGFDEANIPRYVLEGEIGASNKNSANSSSADNTENLVIKKIEVPSFVKFKRISGSCKDIRTELEKYKYAADEKVFVELYYRKEQGINIHEELESIIADLPENITIANCKAQDTKNIMAGNLGSLDATELKNLSAEEIFSSLIMAKNSFAVGDENAKKKMLERYLPHFLKIAADVENGVPDENK